MECFHDRVREGILAALPAAQPASGFDFLGGGSAAAAPAPTGASSSAFDFLGGGGAPAPTAAAAPSFLAGEERLNIRTDYVRGAGAGAPAAQLHFVHPVTGQTLPIADASEHLRIELIDPKWHVERARAATKFAIDTSIPSEEVAENLRRLAARRADIFGGGGAAPAGSVAASAPSVPSQGGQPKRARGE
jgi:hypothetical protein